jgi:hypothetical protein
MAIVLPRCGWSAKCCAQPLPRQFGEEHFCTIRASERFGTRYVFTADGTKYIHMAAGVRQQGTGEQPMRESIVRLALGVMLLALSVPAAAQ